MLGLLFVGVVVTTLLTLTGSFLSLSTHAELEVRIGALRSSSETLEQNITSYIRAEIAAIDHNDTIRAIIDSFNFTEIFETYDIDVTSTSDVIAIIDEYNFTNTVTEIVLRLIDEYNFTDTVMDIVTPLLDQEVDSLNASLYAAIEAKIAAFDHVGLVQSVIANYDYTDIFEAFNFAPIVTAIVDPLLDTRIDEYDTLLMLAVDNKIDAYDHVGTATGVVAAYDYSTIFATYDDVNVAADVEAVIAAHDYTAIFAANEQDLNVVVGGYDFSTMINDQLDVYPFPTNCTAVDQVCMHESSDNMTSRLSALYAIDPDANTPAIVESYNYLNEAGVIGVIDAYDFTSKVSATVTPDISPEVSAFEARLDVLEVDQRKSLRKTSSTNSLSFVVLMPHSGSGSVYYNAFATITASTVSGTGVSSGALRASYSVIFSSTTGSENAMSATMSGGLNPSFSRSRTANGANWQWTITVTGSTYITAKIEVYSKSGVTSIT